jgi:hypothetical protein
MVNMREFRNTARAREQTDERHAAAAPLNLKINLRV